MASTTAPDNRRGEPNPPQRLTCDYLTTPIGLTETRPRLAWQLDDRRRKAQQTAYQIQVATSPQRLASGEADLWDSSRVNSNRTTQIDYAGKPLISNQRCYWHVRIWDQHGNASAYSKPALWHTGLLQSGDWQAEWIGPAETLPAGEKMAAPSPFLRCAFTLNSRAQHATLYATALGVYEVHLNGQRAAANVLAPEWTDYHQRLQVQAHDVTSLLQPGENVIGAVLAPGWYAGRIGMFGTRLYGDRLGLLCQLMIETSDGKQELICSSAGWRYTIAGPIRRADIIDGETVDARLDLGAWSQPGYDDAVWHHVQVLPPVKAKLVGQPCEPIRVTQTISPTAISEPQPGRVVVDFGQNLVGRCRLLVRASEGTRIEMRHGEMLAADGTLYTENLRGDFQRDVFVSAGKGKERFQPSFTYHGFRYVELTGLPELPKPDHLKAHVMHSALAVAGDFACSDVRLNRLMHNIVWGLRGNLYGIPTDCPQRNERLGWTGDILVFAQSACFLMNMAAFLTKWLQDMRDAQMPDGRFPDIAPNPVREQERPFLGAPGWGDAGVVVPWRLFENYGDRRVLEQQYEAGCRWVEFIRRANPDLIWEHQRGNDYGDWLNGDAVELDGWPKKGAEADKSLVATAFFAQSTRILQRMAAVLGRDAEMRRHAESWQAIRRAFQQRFLDSDGRLQDGSQAACALALYYDLVADRQRPAVFAQLLQALERYDFRLATGFHTTLPLMQELVRGGRSDLAYRLLLNKTPPSWLYMLAQGATTVWERWDSFVAGRGMQNPEMNSFNHYTLGAVAEWMYQHIAGLQLDPDYPGWQRFRIAPQPGGGLTWVRACHHAIPGTIASAWRLDNDKIVLEVTIPPNTEAAVVVPTREPDSVREGELPAAEAEGVGGVVVREDGVEIAVAAGSYHFIAAVRQ